jgi:hypothetical protein
MMQALTITERRKREKCKRKNEGGPYALLRNNGSFFLKRRNREKNIFIQLFTNQMEVNLFKLLL